MLNGIIYNSKTNHMQNTKKESTKTVVEKRQLKGAKRKWKRSDEHNPKPKTVASTHREV